MILTFTVSVDVADYYGEAQVPYLKHLLSGHAGHVGIVTNVQYEEWLTDKGDRRASEIEYAAWEHGEMDL